MVDIEIDGQQLQAKEGSMIIEAADAAGIHIPRFCYHKKLSIAANCRMCLIEVDKVGKPLPACATPVAPNMKVFTRSARAVDAQKSVMEFLLINHPLDCPICDQGGQCELQDTALVYGEDASHYTEGKRAVADEDLGPLVATDMTRCIHCTRCVRFGEEIAGIREMGATGRGEHMKIGTYIKHSLKSELSGNIIDVCPVGALTSKPFRFRARAWELHQHEGIAPHDCLGSNIYTHTNNENLMRVVPRENEMINEVWISDRDRYSYEGLKSADRLRKPQIKRDGKWQDCEWSDALNFVAERLQKLKLHHSANQIGGLISPSATLEEHYLFQKLLRTFGCNNIDHRLRETDFSNQDSLPLYPNLGIKIEDLEKINALLLVGSDIQRDQPIAGHRVRKAALKSAHVNCINFIDYEFNFHVTNKIISHPAQIVSHLMGVLKVAAEDAKATLSSDVTKLLSTITVEPQHRAIAESLKKGELSAIILGSNALHHPQAATLFYVAQQIAKLTQSTVGCLSDGANSAGAWMAGTVPHRKAGGGKLSNVGLTTTDMFSKELKAYFLFNVEPELDCANPAAAINALTKADLVISLSPFKGGVLDAQADVILPIATFGETSGTFVNVEGSWQSFAAAIHPLDEVRPGWKVLRVLGNILELPGFDYVTSEQIRDEVTKKVTDNNSISATQEYTKPNTMVELSMSELTRITVWPLYRSDSLVRRSRPLQESAANEKAAICLNPHYAKKFNLQNGDTAVASQNGQGIELPLRIDERIPDACVYIAGGFCKTAKLGESFGRVEIKKIGS